MEPILVLGALKYLGIVAAAASSIFGIVAKPTYEDDQGRRRLTAAGHVAIAIVGLSALVGLVAYGFQSVVEDAARQHQSELARQQETERKIDATQLRLLTLAEAEAQRRRLDDLNEKVSQGSAENLRSTSRALGQIDRLVNPLSAMSVSIIWNFPTSTPEIRKLVAGLKQYADHPSANVPGIRPELFGDTVNTYWFDDKFPSFPDKRVEPDLYTALSSGGVDVSFYKTGRNVGAAKARLVANKGVVGIYDRSADFAFTTAVPGIQLLYDVDNSSLRIRVASEVDLPQTRGNGSISSIVDLEEASLAIAVRRDGIIDVPTTTLLSKERNAMFPRFMIIRVSGRVYVVDKFTRIENSYGEPVFLAGPLRMARATEATTPVD